jgi:hypothetical protein
VAAPKKKSRVFWKTRVFRLVGFWVGLSLLAGLVVRLVWGLEGGSQPWVAGLIAVPVVTFVGSVYCAWPALKDAWLAERRPLALEAAGVSESRRSGESKEELQALVEELGAHLVALDARSARLEAELTQTTAAGQKATADLEKTRADLKETQADLKETQAKLERVSPGDSARYIAGWVLLGVAVVTTALSGFLTIAGTG